MLHANTTLDAPDEISLELFDRTSGLRGKKAWLESMSGVKSVTLSGRGRRHFYVHAYPFAVRSIVAGGFTVRVTAKDGGAWRVNFAASRPTGIRLV